MNLILLGPPGAGKGTQARKLCETYDLALIATGEILKEEIRQETSLGLEVKEIMNAGRFPADEIILRIFEEHLLKVKNQGLLLDGIPRTLAQAEKISEIFKRLGMTVDAVIQLDVNDEELIKRLASRMVCKSCGASYPGKVSVCGACGGHEFEKRADDTPETIKTRLEVYNERTRPLVDYYAQKGLLRVVDGMQSVQDVFDHIKKEISFLKFSQ